MKRIDREALERAMKMAQRDKRLKAQLEDHLKDRSWEDVAKTAAWNLQYTNLKLMPHQSPPGWAMERDEDQGGMDLLNRLLAAGLSRYEPDPLAALAKVGK
jgi:hypothetical protein